MTTHDGASVDGNNPDDGQRTEDTQITERTLYPVGPGLFSKTAMVADNRSLQSARTAGHQSSVEDDVDVANPLQIGIPGTREGVQSYWDALTYPDEATLLWQMARDVHEERMECFNNLTLWMADLASRRRRNIGLPPKS